MVITGWILTCDSAHQWQRYSAAPVGDQAAGTMVRLLTQLQYTDTELTIPCPILVMPIARLGSDKYQFCKSMV